MAHLIDKSALVAEIERQQRRLDILGQSNEVELRKDAAIQNGVYCSLLSFLDTLEVKEVDFEKELDRIWFDNKLGNYFDNDALDFAHVRTICKHFFELGLKAQKGE